MHPDRIKTCPRCGGAFCCRPHQVDACQCVGVTLDETVSADLAGRFTDCLCIACLQEEQRNQPQPHAPADPSVATVEGTLHSP